MHQRGTPLLAPETQNPGPTGDTPTHGGDPREPPETHESRADFMDVAEVLL
jgi:hypothetical protein